MSNNWIPVIGQETKDFLKHACPDKSEDLIRDEAVKILGKGVAPTAANKQETGLVIGYVQSGKTLSFEAVLTLAHDNKFPIVIVLAGTSNLLLSQSTSRIRKDLRLDELNRSQNWVQLTNPDNTSRDKQYFQSVIKRWDGSLPSGVSPQTLLITVLKHPSRINKLTKLIEACGVKKQPVLVLDDEADQASLNTQKNTKQQNKSAQENIEQQSKTYKSILKLKSCFDKLTYLQYTATPQAPLLINIIDALSPNFVHVLPVGEQYVGGKEFFDDNSDKLRTISNNEVPSKTNPLNEPPTSLISALMIYIVGATVRVDAGDTDSHISMLVHPSHLQMAHTKYIGWVKAITKEWKAIILDAASSDYQELMNDFEASYNDLLTTVTEDISSFEVIKQWFSFVLNDLQIEKVNSSGGKTSEIQWAAFKFWILVGGQALDRGYTVEGLTVTYMPRGPGVGNADTIQQRARFFGYKRKYFGYCRVFLSESTRHAYRAYVQHEEDIRQQMLNVQHSDQNLDDWKRSFILDAALRPTRASVIEKDFIRANWSDSWTGPKRPLNTGQAQQSNQSVASNFISTFQFTENEGHIARATGQKHLINTNIPLNDVLHNLLGVLEYEDIETKTTHSMLLVHLSKVLDEHPHETCMVYKMASDSPRMRELTDDFQVKQLFQGANPKSASFEKSEVYAGDREMRSASEITVQIHQLELKLNGQTKSRNVPVVVVWIPSRLSASLVHQL